MEKKEAKKKERWTSIQRLEKAKKTEKADKIRWRLRLKKINETKQAHKKLRQARKKNRLMLIEKGVIKQA